jgi:hypothetical protein
MKNGMIEKMARGVCQAAGFAEPVRLCGIDSYSLWIV